MLNALSSETPPLPQPHTVSGWRRSLVAPLAWAVRLWTASLHFEISPEARKIMTQGDRPLAFVLWHNRLFLVAEIHRRYRGGRRVYGLVSASKDGAWLDAFFSMVGMYTVRGSSSKGGREAVQGLIEVVRAGHDIGITPDGPRGPRYECKGGPVIVARRAQGTVVLLGGVFESAWQLRSWDRFYLPRPFSRVRIYAREMDGATLPPREEAARLFEHWLTRLNPDQGPDRTSATV